MRALERRLAALERRRPAPTPPRVPTDEEWAARFKALLARMGGGDGAGLRLRGGDVAAGLGDDRDLDAQRAGAGAGFELAGGGRLRERALHGILSSWGFGPGTRGPERCPGKWRSGPSYVREAPCL